MKPSEQDLKDGLLLALALSLIAVVVFGAVWGLATGVFYALSLLALGCLVAIAGTWGAKERRVEERKYRASLERLQEMVDSIRDEKA